MLVHCGAELELNDETEDDDSELELIATLELLDNTLDEDPTEDTVLETDAERDELELLLLSPPQAVSNPATDRAMKNEIGFMTSAPQKEGDASFSAIGDTFMING